MKRIVIIGSQGAGKSTLARKLGDLLNIPVFHLDRYFWQYGWQRRSSESRIAILDCLTKNDLWIIEGSYLNFTDNRYIDLRCDAADTIIFLDTLNLICFIHMIVRHIRDRGKPRSDLPEGCTDKLTLYRLLMALLFPWRERKGLLFRFNKIKKVPSKRFYQLRSKRDHARLFADIAMYCNRVAAPANQPTQEVRESCSVFQPRFP